MGYKETPALDEDGSDIAYEADRALEFTNPTNAHYSIGSGGNDNSSLIQAERYRFIKAREEKRLDTYSVYFYAKHFYKNGLALVDDIKANYIVNDTLHLSMFCDDVFRLHSDELFIYAHVTGSNEWIIQIWGGRAICEELQLRLGKDETKVNLNWWYRSDDGSFDYCTLDFAFNQTSKDEYYPYIQDGIDNYLKAYFEDPAPLLLLMGVPGSGKTSFIKHFIKTFRLNTMVTYDADVMKTDFFYIQYLTDNKKQLLVIEDADHLLTSREEDNNKTMTKLLNLSDGLIKLEAKKIIFTTNLNNINRIDNALIRPGRCFDVIDFRSLTFVEAKVACKAAEIPEVTEDKEYNLTDIFNRRVRSSYAHKRRIGF